MSVHSLYRKYICGDNFVLIRKIYTSFTQSCKHLAAPPSRANIEHDGSHRTLCTFVPAASAADSASAAEADSVSPPTPCLSFMAQEQQIKCNGVGFQRHYGGCRAVHPGILCTCSTSGRNHHTARPPGQARQAGWPIHNSRTFRSNHVFSGSYCCNRVPPPLFSTASDAAAALPVQPRVRPEAATSSELACTPRGRVRGQGKVRRATVSILPFYAFSS